MEYSYCGTDECGDAVDGSGNIMIPVTNMKTGSSLADVVVGSVLSYGFGAIANRYFIRPAAAKTSTNVYKHSFKYADRVRMRGVQDPVSHNFPYSFDDAILATKPIPKNNGYQMFQLNGTMNGKNGVFEIGLTKDGIIDHRFFRPIK